MGLQERVLGVGIDESNHGRDDEIFVAVFSNIFSDMVIEKDNIYPKVKKPQAKSFSPKLRNRPYSFAVLPLDIADIIPKNKLIGTVVGSLVQDLNPNEFDILKIFLDGEWQKK